MDILDVVLLCVIILGELANLGYAWKKNGRITKDVAEVLAKAEDKFRKRIEREPRTDTGQRTALEPGQTMPGMVYDPYYGLIPFPGPGQVEEKTAETADEFVKRIGGK